MLNVSIASCRRGTVLGTAFFLLPGNKNRTARQENQLPQTLRLYHCLLTYSHPQTSITSFPQSETNADMFKNVLAALFHVMKVNEAVTLH